MMLVDVAVLTNFNSEPVSQLDPETRKYLEDIGFKLTGERMIRGGIVDPQPREIAERALFHRHFLHQNTRLENEVIAMRKIPELSDDFALREPCGRVITFSFCRPRLQIALLPTFDVQGYPAPS